MVWAWSWVFDDPATYAEQSRPVWTLFVEGALPHGFVRMTDGGEAVSELCGRGGDGLDVGARHLDVLPRADLAAQVADRAAQEARAEVEPEHERGLVHRLEEGRPVLRAVGVVVGLADEACLEQRLERP